MTAMQCLKFIGAKAIGTAAHWDAEREVARTTFAELSPASALIAVRQLMATHAVQLTCWLCLVAKQDCIPQSLTLQKTAAPVLDHPVLCVLGGLQEASS